MAALAGAWRVMKPVTMTASMKRLQPRLARRSLTTTVRENSVVAVGSQVHIPPIGEQSTRLGSRVEHGRSTSKKTVDPNTVDNLVENSHNDHIVSKQ